MATLLLLLIALAIAAATPDSCHRARGNRSDGHQGEALGWGRGVLRGWAARQGCRVPRRLLPADVRWPRKPASIPFLPPFSTPSNQPTRCVVLHGSDMEIGEVRLGGPEGQQGGRAAWRFTCRSSAGSGGALDGRQAAAKCVGGRLGAVLGRQDAGAAIQLAAGARLPAWRRRSRRRSRHA